MILEISGGKGGFKEYLEHGKKKGRELHRDQLDQRVALVGDLDVFELATSTHGGSGHLYDHITLSFSESHVSDEMLLAAVNEFRDHALAAWPESERHRIAFYAEAHRPRMLSYLNSETGEKVERLTHVHIGLGKHDLLTGQSIEPLGFLGAQFDNLKYLDAWQESFNTRHGFASPKDNPKITPENAVDVLARYTGHKPDELGSFNGKKAAFELGLQKEIIARNVITWEGFGKLLALHGQVSKMREGQFGECYRVVPNRGGRAMRLQGVFFQRQFIERPTSEKIAALAEKARRAYVEQMQPRREPKYLEATLLEWHQIKAREHRYVHTGSKFYKDTYKPANAATRKHLLDQLERKSHEIRSTTTTQHRQVTASRNRVPRMPARNMDGIQRRTEMLLLRDSSMDVRTKSETGSAGAGMRQADGAGGWGSHTLLGLQTQPSSVLARIKAEQRERYEQASDKDRYAEIRRNLDCTQLLVRLSHSHGIDPNRYQVIQADDGSPRIRCGTRKVTPSDYLMKELGLSWREAAPILRQVYEHQIGKKAIRDKVQSAPTYLWRIFKKIQAAESPAITARLAEFDEETKAQRKALSEALKNAQNRAVVGLSGVPRKVALALEKLHAARSKAEFSEQRRADRKLLRPTPAQAWRTYLQACAQEGDAVALRSLRSLDATARDVPEVSISGVIVLDHRDDENAPKRRARKSSVSFLNELTYQVDVNGDITYRKHGMAVLRDEGQHVAVLDQNSEEAIAAALLIAVEKFGTNLTLTGTPEFQRRVVSVAVSNGIGAKFENPQLESLRLRSIAEQRQVDRPELKGGQKTVTKVNQITAPVSEGELQHTNAKKQTNDIEDLAKLVEYLQAAGLTLADVEEGGLYTGNIMQITDFHAVQKTGRDSVVIHNLDRLGCSYSIGQHMEIVYRGGVGLDVGPEPGHKKGAEPER